MKYPYKTYMMEVEGHSFWVAESEDLKGCVGQADSLEEAVKALEENESVWLETAKEEGIPIPKIHAIRAAEYSGALSLRIPKTVHADLAKKAQMENCSINQYINMCISKELGRSEERENKTVEKVIIFDGEFKEILKNYPSALRLNAQRGTGKLMTPMFN